MPYFQREEHQQGGVPAAPCGPQITQTRGGWLLECLVLRVYGRAGGERGTYHREVRHRPETSEIDQIRDVARGISAPSTSKFSMELEPLFSSCHKLLNSARAEKGGQGERGA